MPIFSQKNEPRKKPKNKPKQPKTIWSELNPETTCFLCNLLQLTISPSFQLQFMNRLRHLIFNFQIIYGLPQKTHRGLS